MMEEFRRRRAEREAGGDAPTQSKGSKGSSKQQSDSSSRTRRQP